MKLPDNGHEPLECPRVVSRTAYGTDENFRELDKQGSASSWIGIVAAGSLSRR
jgi:hypothetical protein